MARDAAEGLRGRGRRALVRIDVSGAGRDSQLARDFSRAQRQLQDDTIRVMRELERDASAVVQAQLREQVDRDTGDLEASIQGRFFIRASSVRFTIVGGVPGHGGDPRPYIDVTRFGHRQQRIFPTSRRALKVHLAGHRAPHIFEFRAWVTGVGHPHPDSVRATAMGGGSIRELRRRHRRVDWLERAMPEIDALAAEAERRIGRNVRILA